MTKKTSENAKELPNGWEWKKLGEVIQLQRGYDLPKQDRVSGSIPLIGSNGRIDTHNIAKVKGAGVITGRSGSIGYIHYEEEDFFPLNTSLFVKEFFGNYPRYIYYLLTSLSDKIRSLASFSAVPTLDRKNVHENIITALPPLKEQERIVQKLDIAFQSLDEAITLQKENIAYSQELKKTVLDEAFLNKSFKIEKLGDVIKFEGGSQPAKDEFLYEYKEGYIRLLQIRDYKSDRHIVYINKKSARRFCNKTDVMIGRYGPPVFQILRGLEGAYNVALMKAIPKKNTLNNDYLYWFLQNGKIQNYVIGLSQRSAGQSGVDKVALEKFQISIPSLPEQERIVAYLDKSFTKLDALIAEQQERLAQLMELKKSILQEAFEGKL